MKWYKILVTVVILSILLVVIDVPTVQAQGGGRCRLVHISTWSRTCGCYISDWVWRCTGYVRPRWWRRH